MALVRAVSVAAHYTAFLLTLALGVWARAEGLFLPPERVTRSGIAGAVAPAQVTGVAVEGRPVLFYFSPDPRGPLSVKMASQAEQGWSVLTVLAGSEDRNVGFFDAAYVNDRLLLVVGIVENQNMLVRMFSAPPSGEEWTLEATENAIWDFGSERHASIVAVGDSVYAAYQDRTLGTGRVGILERKGGLWSPMRPDMEPRANPSLITGIVSGGKPHFLLGTDSRDPLHGVLDGDSWRFSVIPGGDLPVLFLLDGRPATVGFRANLRGLAIERFRQDGTWEHEDVLPLDQAVRSYDAIEYRGQPLLAYYLTNAGKPQLRTSFPQAGAWSHEDLVEATGGEWLRQIDLFDLDGKPAIAFTNTEDGFLYFARVNEPSSRQFLRGDANSDLKSDIADIVWMVSELFRGGPRTTCAEASDANGDGTYDAADPMTLVQYTFLQGPPLPSPFPTCGDFTGPDLLACENSTCSAEPQG